MLRRLDLARPVLDVRAEAMIGQGNVDLPAATFLILLALAWSLNSVVREAVKVTRRHRARRHRTDLCPLCRRVTWTGGLCHRCAQ